MDAPSDLRYTKDHEWVRVEGEEATVGITDFAQGELGDIVFVEFPEEGTEIVSGDSVCVVESTKAASDVYSPISGKVSEVNKELENAPELINSDPYGDGWLVKLEDIDTSELEELMSAEEYIKFVEEEA
ncbi:MAG: glycine cleavage system protein GcvH [Candidatus Dadabacteria bacterium]|nr:MAG: glycine cleavage system protein GcvH [Candidatus Dadabacteria bacterium]